MEVDIRIRGEKSAKTRLRLLEAATESFVSNGYHATTTREIATKAGLSPAAMYVHFASKQDVLFELIDRGHREAHDALEWSIRGIDDPKAALRAAVFGFTEWHAINHRLGRISQYEFRSLTANEQAVIAKTRRAIDSVIRGILEEGVRRGVFSAPDIQLTSLAILALSIDLVRWFPSRSFSDPTGIASSYADIASQMVAA